MSEGKSCCSDGEKDTEEDSCCCDGNNASECCSDAELDEPNLGHKEPVKIEYLYLDQSVCDRCQGGDDRVVKAIGKLRPVMDMAGYSLELERIEITDEKLAEKHRFLSSPTVRVNGVDICSEVIENPCDCCRTLSDYDVYCRQFPFNGKLFEVPPTALVTKRILEIVLGGEKPADGPYEMPENIRGFLANKHDKETGKAKDSGEEKSSSCCKSDSKGTSSCC